MENWKKKIQSKNEKKKKIKNDNPMNNIEWKIIFFQSYLNILFQITTFYNLFIEKSRKIFNFHEIFIILYTNLKTIITFNIQ